jgi:serine/threonine protein kinase
VRAHQDGAIRVGSQVGPYELAAEIGRGGMARLFVGRRRGPGGFSRRVAIKVLAPELAQIPEMVRMFLDEARLTAAIHHPNVVHVEELGEHAGLPYLVMEHIDGAPLVDVLRALAHSRRLPAADVSIAIAARIAEGLHAAHEITDELGRSLELVHRDVSPQNVLIDAHGEVKLIDFGVAKARDRLAQSRPGEAKGKLAYMSPEQLSGQPIDRRTDVFALGVVVWEMLTLRRLFARADDLTTILAIRSATIDPPSRFRDDLDPRLDWVIATALARALDERFTTTMALRCALLASCREAIAIDASAIAAFVREVAPDVLAQRRSATGITPVSAR